MYECKERIWQGCSQFVLLLKDGWLRVGRWLRFVTDDEWSGRSEHRTSPEQEVVNPVSQEVGGAFGLLGGSAKPTMPFDFVPFNQSQSPASLLHDPH